MNRATVMRMLMLMSKNDENQGLDYLGYLEEGQRYQQQGNLKLAEECFSNAIKLDLSDFRAYLRRGALHQKQWNFELALNDFNQAINCNQKNSVAYLKRGDIYQAQGKFELALQDYDYAIDNLTFPNNNFLAEFFLSRGLVFQKQKNFDRAQEDFTQAIKFKNALGKNSSKAYWYLGMLHIEREDLSKAQENFNKAIIQATNQTELKKSILIEAHSYYIKNNKFDLARECIKIAFSDYGDSRLETQNKEMYLNHIKTYEDNTNLIKKMQKIVQQYTHTLGNTIFPRNLLEVARKLGDSTDFKKESLLLYSAYDAEVFIIHQSELLRYKYVAQNSEQFRNLIRQDISLSNNEPATNIEQILNNALKRVILRFLNYAKFNEIRKRVLAQRSLSLLELQHSFEEQIFFKNQLSLDWVDANLFPIKVDFSKNWQSVKLKENGFAESLLFGYFYELFFNIFKYSDYQGVELQFDDQEIDGCAYLVSKWKNSYVDNTSIGTEMGLESIQEDLRQLHDSENEATTLQKNNNANEKIFQVILPLRKDLLICKTFKFPRTRKEK
jgi:tetratricopeptide (TPR) repeat protein